jgi:hypothetical protein
MPPCASVVAPSRAKISCTPPKSSGIVKRVFNTPLESVVACDSVRVVSLYFLPRKWK